MKPGPDRPVESGLDRIRGRDEEGFRVGGHHGQEGSGALGQPAPPGYAVGGDDCGRQAVDYDAERLVLDRDDWSAITRGDPRIGPAEPVTRSEDPLDVDEPREDFDPLGEFGPGRSAGRSNIESSGDACDAGGGGVGVQPRYM
jgi:hypothetical protein